MGASWALATLAPLASAAPQDFERVAAPFLTRYCVRCHGGEHVQGGLDLSRFKGDDEVRGARDDWDWLRERVATREMPPSGELTPTDGERAAFEAWLAPLLSGASHEAGVTDSALAPPGRPVMRRLTRRAYEHAARDLFGVTFDARRLLPEDPLGYGFEGVGEAQAFGDSEVELYLAAAEALAARALVVDPPGGPRKRRIGPEAMSGPGAGGGARWNLNVNGAVGADVELPRAGRYRVRAGVRGQQAGDEPVRVTLQLGEQESARFDVDGASGDDEADGGAVDTLGIVEAEFDAPAPKTRAAVRFVNDYYAPNDPDPARRDRNLHIHWIDVIGPLDATPRTPLLNELEAAAEGERGRGRVRAALLTLGRRVWRRPLTDRELGRLERLSKADDGFAARMQIALAALLASPNFLFLVEGTRDPGDAEVQDQVDLDDDLDGLSGARRLTGPELAARLAFCLWVSVPDPELDALVDAGRLADRDVLLAQVERMLADPRAEALVDAFALPWLHLEGLATRTVDEAAYPEFGPELRRSMLGETRRVLRRHLAEETPLVELLDGTRTFVDARLAALYGAPFEASGGRWQEIDVGALGRRGLLGHASVLTVTSEPTRTSPVKRGKWVLDVLLGSPPPPPPPGVDSLDAGAGADLTLPLRERLALHRSEPNCAVCHARMDPLGFGLEGFDAIGRVRAGADALGELPDGRTFDGAAQLVEVLRADGGLTRQVAERLFVYMLGRPLLRSDRAHVVALLESAAHDAVARSGRPEPTLRGLVRALVTSRAFGWVDSSR